MFLEAFTNRRVLITGHTGFKGAWLTEWLLELGAEVRGYSLDPPTEPSLFEQLGLERRIGPGSGEVLDRTDLSSRLQEWQPEFIFHLAAQSLVRRSYQYPVETFSTNVMGTVHLLEALRQLDHPCTAVIITSDKCYQNREWVYGYRENDPLGGADPYSASKAMAEIATEAYRQSFFQKGTMRIASARGGNVIGGGDWAEDRIVPDSIRALQSGKPIPVRNQQACRPWQHVLEPLGGYLQLAARLAQLQTREDLQTYGSAFNFGPQSRSSRSVGELVEAILACWPGSYAEETAGSSPHEAQRLALCTDKAQSLLGWRSRWDFNTTVRETVSWYRRVHGGEDPRTVTLEQIHRYGAALGR
jgi:CDP-glucose 4,6-dehydratase